MDHEASMHNPLERMLLDANAEPTDLSLSLLKAITNNFSDEIGSGGFAVVYKGLLKNGAVAVKKLSQTVDIDEKRFNQEVDCLMKAKHKNIVRFLGYCADTQGKVWNLEGKNVMAEVRQRLLCFEYLPKGSLDQYITDASQGLEWRTRYQIIKGICEGLHYLHQKKIVHLDLKPANILLDYDMVPKIADFGLSRCFGEEQSQAITSKLVGSLGYLAPEFYSGVITFKLDIYSLGVIIIEILTGKKGYPAVENILESWSSRFKTSEGDTRLEQIRVCAEIGLECIDSNPVKRPITQCIIEALNKMESRYNFVATDRCTSSETHASSYVYPAASSLQRITWAPKEPEETSTEIRSFGSTATSKLLDVHPLEICLPFEPNKRIECPVTLTNRTEQFVGVWITPTCQETCSELCLPVSLGDESLDDPCSTIFKMLGPRSTWATAMTMKEQREPPPQDIGKFGVLMVVTPTQGSLRSLVSSVDSKLNMDSNFWKKVEALEAEVHQAILSAAICYAANCQKVIPHNFIRTEEFGAVKSIDVHPTETWILLSHYWHFTMEGDNNISRTGEYVSIWDYQKQERVMMLQVTKEPGWLNFFTRTSISCSVRLAKFIARERWFAAGDGEGHVHIYAYAKRHKVKEFVAHRGKSVTSLAVHPTYQFLLTASDKDHLIKLWDWGKGWRCTRTFDHGHIDGISCVSFNARNDNTFASSADIGTEIWEIHSSSPIATLKGSYKSDYCYAANQHLLVTRNDDICDDTTYIWNSHTEQLVHMLTMQGRSWRNFACHPTLPILVTGLRSGIICLWDATTFRLKKMVHYPEGMGEGGADLVFIGSKDSIRLVITHALSCEIVILEINVPPKSMCNLGN